MAREKKERKLTEAEEKRLEEFNANCKDLESLGYRRTDLSISIFWANVIAIVAVIALFAICMPLFNMLHPNASFVIRDLWIFAYFAAYIVLIVVHELIHGLTWSFFTPGRFKDIAFGIMRDSFTPYCTCTMPLEKTPYILGALAPLVILGIIPLVAAFIVGSIPLLFAGILMTDGAAGDIMIVAKILAHKTTSSDVLLYDHPTAGGSVIFER